MPSLPISDSAVEAAAQALYVAERGPWISGGAITPGGTPWGTSREDELHATYFERAEAALYAAAPHIRLAINREAIAEELDVPLGFRKVENDKRG